MQRATSIAELAAEPRTLYRNLIRVEIQKQGAYMGPFDFHRNSTLLIAP